MPLVIGLDIGTTSAKAVAFTESGEAVAAGRAQTPWRNSPDGVEMDTYDLAGVIGVALDEAITDVPIGEHVAALGITSMGESGVLLDAHGQPVAPVIAWHDTRDSAEVEALRQEIGPAEFCATTGKPLRGQFSLTKHRWLTRHRPETQRAVRRLNVAEYAVVRLGGEEACELSLASRTGWLDIRRRAWWSAALDFSGATEALMPPLVRAGQPLGRVTEGPDRLRGAVLTLAGHDHQAAALGAGITAAGDELDSCGTAEALLRTIPPNLTRDQIRWLAERGVTTDWSVVPGHGSLLAATEGGLAMERTLALLGVDRAGLRALDRAAADAPTGRIRIAGIGGADLRIGGITEDTSPGEVWRAVVEAVTAEAVRLHEAMTKIAGPPRELVVTGGWAHSDALLRAKRAHFGPFRVSEAAEAGARGAALLAARAAGLLGPHESFPERPHP